MMKGYGQLTLAQLRIFARNRQVLIWTMLFPIILMVGMGTFTGNNQRTALSVGIVDEDGTQGASALIATLKKTPGITIERYASKEAAERSVKAGDNTLAVVLPKGISGAMQKTGTPFSLPVYYDETNLSQAQLGLSVLNGVIDNISKAMVKYEPTLMISAVGIQGLHLRYIDFLVPGIVAMMIMNNNMNGVAGQIAAWRERGILRRMQGTRLKASTFIASQITARLALNGTQALLVLLIANLFFGVTVQGSWLTLILIVILGTLAFMSLGFIIAGIARTPESAAPIAGLLTFPMLFLGGVFFPVNQMPGVLQPIVKVLPISHLSTALRETMNVGVSISTLWPQLLILAGWLLFGFFVASKTFKWDY